MNGIVQLFEVVFFLTATIYLILGHPESYFENLVLGGFMIVFMMLSEMIRAIRANKKGDN